MTQRGEHEKYGSVYVRGRNRDTTRRSIAGNITNVTGCDGISVRRIVSKGENFSPIPRR